MFTQWFVIAEVKSMRRSIVGQSAKQARWRPSIVDPFFRSVMAARSSLASAIELSVALDTIGISRKRAVGMGESVFNWHTY